MTAELAVYEPHNSLTEQMEYARAVSVAHMLPENYRGKPADIMLAVGLGQSMGLSPAESLYRISVIKGKPTASAELIAANVRKAGHRLRVATDEAAQSVTATILRADDPDFAFEVTRDMKWAADMGLASNDNYRKQALTMLQWRAITAVARLACPEALYGVSYSPDEMGDLGDRPGLAPVEQQPASAADRMRGILNVEQVTDDPGESEGLADLADSIAMLDTRGALAKRMFATFRDRGIDDKDERLAYIANVINREIASSSEMTEDEASATIDALEAMGTTA